MIKRVNLGFIYMLTSWVMCSIKACSYSVFCCKAMAAFSASSFLSVDELSLSPLDSSVTKSTTSIWKQKDRIDSYRRKTGLIDAIQTRHTKTPNDSNSIWNHLYCRKRQCTTTRTFSFERPFSPRFLLTDIPPANVSLLQKEQLRKCYSTWMKNNITLIVNIQDVWHKSMNKYE